MTHVQDISLCVYTYPNNPPSLESKIFWTQAFQIRGIQSLYYLLDFKFSNSIFEIHFSLWVFSILDWNKNLSEYLVIIMSGKIPGCSWVLYLYKGTSMCKCLLATWLFLKEQKNTKFSSHKLEFRLLIPAHCSVN